MERVAERFRRGKHVVQQAYHSKIKILGKVKSEKVVAKSFSNEFKKLDLTTDADPNVGIVYLSSRQTSLAQQRFDVSALFLRARECEPGNSALGAWDCLETPFFGIAHRPANPIDGAMDALAISTGARSQPR